MVQAARKSNLPLGTLNTQAMKVTYQTENPLTNDASKAATGRTLEEWYAYLDEFDGLTKGRKLINNHLYGELKIDIWWTSAIAVEYERERGVKEKDGLYKGYFICSTKTINAPLEKVYANWSSADALSKWFGDATKADVADGGSFSSPDGNTGVFKRVRQNKDLRFTWSGPEGESLVDVQFTDKGNGKTGLLVNHDRLQTRAEADGVRAAWGEALNRLKAISEA
jgi:uncharacterized protein YndB with AHSA1/START domain